MDLLRFVTAGSVDDGKSTLIGRLLYDSKSIFEDQLEAVKRAKNHDALRVSIGNPAAHHSATPSCARTALRPRFRSSATA